MATPAALRTAETVAPHARARRSARAWRALRLATLAVSLFVVSFGGRLALQEAILDGSAMALALALLGDRIWHGVGAVFALARLRGAAVPERLKERIRGRLKLRWLLVGSVLDVVALVLFAVYLLSHELFRGETLIIGPTRDATIFRAALTITMISTALEFDWLTARLERLAMTPGRVIVAGYLGIAALGTLLLVLPATLQPHAHVALIDAFFVAVAAITVTGLFPIPFTETYNLLGQAIILAIIQVGGIGIVTVTAVLTLLASRGPSLRHTVVGQEFFGLPALGEIGPFIVKVVAFTLTAEAIGAALLMLTFPPGAEGRFYHSVFHAVAAFCNAGVSSFANGLEFEGAPGFKTVIAILVVLGGIGFPVIFEVKARFFAKDVVQRRFSDSTSLVLRTTATLLVGGFLAILFLQMTEKELSLALVGESAFYSVSARTAGYGLSPFTDLTFNAQVIVCLLMVIGGSPLSTAGGIKTTTFAIILLAAGNFIRGRSWIQFGRSEVSLVLLQRAVTIVVVFAGLGLTSFLALALLEPHDNWLLMFETLAALSTAGFSLGLTSQLSEPSKLILIFLMITGRIGIITMIYAGVGLIREQRFRYPKGRIYVG